MEAASHGRSGRRIGLLLGWVRAGGLLMNIVHTKDLSDLFFAGLVATCQSLRCAPEDMLLVMTSESGILPNAWNRNGNASGLVQFMPATLQNLGWKNGHEAFRKLSAEQQLPFVRAYFWAHRGKLVNATAVYLATFLPALLKHATEPDYKLVVKGGQLGWAYAPNIGFDADHDGDIEVQELTQRLSKVTTYPRYVEACARAAEMTPIAAA